MDTERQSMRRKHHFSRAGFSLVEFAVVMGIIGLIVGAIWAYSTNAWENTRYEQAMEAVNDIVTNVRGFYIGQQGVPKSGGDALTQTLIGQGTIPSSLLRHGDPCTLGTLALKICADNPWGLTDPAGAAKGTLAVCDWTLGAQLNCSNPAAAGVAQMFAVELRGLNMARCLQLAQRISIATLPAGYVGMSVNGLPVLGPVPMATANAKCVDAVTNILSVIYKLRV
jgi:type II secretory pathway pseudopilin PulG